MLIIQLQDIFKYRFLYSDNVITIIILKTSQHINRDSKNVDYNFSINCFRKSQINFEN